MPILPETNYSYLVRGGIPEPYPPRNSKTTTIRVTRRWALGAGIRLLGCGVVAPLPLVGQFLILDYNLFLVLKDRREINYSGSDI